MDLASLIDIRVDADALARDLAEFEQSLERAVLAGLDAAAQRLALEAQTNHVYRNRTGDLQGSTLAQDAEGDVWRDSAVSSVSLGERYAPYVDAWAAQQTGGGILEYAYERVRGPIEAEFEEILARAAGGG